MTNLRFKWVGRYQPGVRILRLFRVMWEQSDGTPKGWHSCKLSVALRPVLWRMAWDGDGQGWFVNLLGVRLHFQRNYGGRHV